MDCDWLVGWRFVVMLARRSASETLLSINPTLQRIGQAVMTEEERAELEEGREREWEAERAEARRQDRERLQVEWRENQPTVYMADQQAAYVPTFQMEEGAEAESTAAARKEQVRCKTSHPQPRC